MKKKHIKPFSVLILDDEMNLFVFVVHCLSQIKDINIYVLSTKKDCEIKYSRKIKNFSYYPKSNDEKDWITNINEEVEKHDIDIIMPVNESEIETLIKFKDRLNKSDRLVILPNLKTYYKANDKGLLAKHMAKHKIPTPESFLIKAINKPFEIKNIKFPVLAKPTLGFYGGRGIIKFDILQDLKLFFDKNNFEHDYLIEEYVEGYDISCNVLCKEGKILAKNIHKGILWQGDSFTPALGLEFVNNVEIYNTTKVLMQTLNWSGVANVNMRYDIVNKQFVVLEINPRFWLNTEASEIVGVNFPYLYCLASLNIEFEEPKLKKQTKAINLRGLSKKVKANKLFLFRFNFIIKNTPIKYYLKDPLPFLYIAKNKICSMLKLNSKMS